MSSLIPGYEYDIFISYRQKDNKYDDWVTGFVGNLRRELEATFKEDISVYFDINPHDGLLATHDVDASLQEKLKCLIFMPIISRTYCDPISFAWEKEFMAFLKLAKEDRFGIKVRLPNGNVASRVLPIQIHDLDPEDKTLVENELGAMLRAVEFIYKEPGVNRPLTPNDDEGQNLNNTRYRNQINRVANAIKEIISGLKSNQSLPLKVKSEKPDKKIDNGNLRRFKKTSKLLTISKRGLILSVFAILILVAAILFAWPRLFKTDRFKDLRAADGRISVAVMPFINFTYDTSMSYWQEGLQNKITYSLSNNSDEFKVRQVESVKGLLLGSGLTNYTAITPALSRTISRKLDANVFISGGINKSGNSISIDAKLYDSKTEEVFQSFEVRGDYRSVDRISDTLSWMIKDFLIISKLKKRLTPDIRNYAYTENPEAFRNFIAGKNSFMSGDYPSARNFFTQAIDIDSNYTLSMQMLALGYGDQGFYSEAKKWSLKAYSRKNRMPFQERIFADWMHALYLGTPEEEINYLNQLKEADDQLPFAYYELGLNYNVLEQYEKGIAELEKAMEIYDRWGTKPMWINNYTSLGYAYHKTGRLTDEKRLYKNAERDFPDDPVLLFRQAILSLSEKDTESANGIIKKYRAIRKANSSNEAEISLSVGDIYSEAGLQDNALEYYKKAVTLDPNNPDLLTRLASFIIDNDRNYDEGMILIGKALKINPGNSDYLDTWGWGLFKQGKIKEAFAVLQKADSLKPVYNHRIYLHLQEVKKAVAERR